FFSLWVDPDLGCWSDDFIGCDVDHEMGLLYNGDDFDEDCSGLNGFESDIPILGVKTIEVMAGQEALPFSSFAYYFNGSSGQPVGSTDPSGPNEIYNYMTGSWRDGTPFSQGGTGYNPGEAPYPYAFDGSQVDGLPWTECNANSTPADRRFLMNYGPTTLEPGEISTFTFAVLWKPSQAYPCPDFTEFLGEGDLAKTFYQEECQNLMNGGIVNKTDFVIEELEIQLLPNPMSTTTQLVLGEGLPALHQVELYSINGQRLHSWINIQSNNLEINRTYLSNGLYFLKIQLADGRQSTRKLVIR
ncbi:MAG: T9SS type A sorting domain-containing protein, partial [Phaeodactylibacter sp.]|nr:T9SS type A sorting domain-containing protein [Phaeodactylibacter sp.]